MRLLALGIAVLLTHLAFLGWLQCQPRATSVRLEPQPPLLVHFRPAQAPQQKALSQPIQVHPHGTKPSKITAPAPGRPSTPVIHPLSNEHEQAKDKSPHTSTEPTLEPTAEAKDKTAHGVATDFSTSTSALPQNSASMAGTTPATVTAKATTLPSVDAHYLDNPAPVYPPLSLRRGEQGTVQIRVLISSQGRALSGEVAQSSGFDQLDRAALRAVLQWRYVAAQADGVAIDKWFTVPVRFRLDEK
ncbi:MAG: energy transducer TonB [Comamonadaceae bacterium CG12_big_fil_rev_8_21_14_0_65_59_15]|nr:MAG: energy transducer TonB [Comamonadaceae bacterium CG12_big_fil_rev_8_21_14_0_65_59_15]